MVDAMKGRGVASAFVTRFKLRKSVQKRIVPSFLRTNTIGADHGEFDTRITPCLSISLTATLICWS